MAPNTWLGISWRLSEGGRETAHLNGRSVAGSKRPVGSWVPVPVIITAVVIIMIVFQIHLMATTGPDHQKKRLKKDVMSAQGPRFWAECFSSNHSHSPLVAVVGTCLCVCSDQPGQINVHKPHTQRSCLAHIHFTAAFVKPESLFKITWQIYWHHSAYAAIFSNRI